MRKLLVIILSLLLTLSATTICFADNQAAPGNDDTVYIGIVKFLTGDYQQVGQYARPKVMLIDEPAAGLNTQEQENAMALMRVAAQEKDIAVLLIEHSMELVRRMCRNIVVLNFGEILAEGSYDVVSSDSQVIEAYLGREVT